MSNVSSTTEWTMEEKECEEQHHIIEGNKIISLI